MIYIDIHNYLINQNTQWHYYNIIIMEFIRHTFLGVQFLTYIITFKSLSLVKTLAS